MLCADADDGKANGESFRSVGRVLEHVQGLLLVGRGPTICSGVVVGVVDEVDGNRRLCWCVCWCRGGVVVRDWVWQGVSLEDRRRVEVRDEGCDYEQ